MQLLSQPLRVAVSLSFIACAAWSLAVAGSEEGSASLAERRLRQLITEESRIFAGSRQTDGSNDEEQLERRVQALVNRYEAFLGDHRESPAGYVAYGRLLERIGRDDAAYAMYLEANRLDPNIPLVKNQLGNILTEEGHFDRALPYFLAAIELEPEEPLYHFQLGNLLHLFRDRFIEADMFSRKLLDQKMLEAFGRAARLAPDNIAYAYRHAEAYYDLEEPQWDEALKRWDELRKKVESSLEQQAIDLHKANVFLQRGEPAEARRLIETVDAGALQQNRQRLASQIEKKEPDEADMPEERGTEREK